jgi:hypothetical protein
MMSIRPLSRCAALGAGLLAALALPGPARADTTRVWMNATYEDFAAGKGFGVLVDSTGRLQRGEPLVRQTLPGLAMVFSLLEADGALYLGTGDKGEVWVRRGDRTTKLASLPGAILVTSLVRGPAGTIYAGTLPEGRIYALRTADGKATPFSQVKADHVWGLAYDARTRTLYAATGPNGQLFAIDAGGRATVHWTAKETHLLSLAQAADGSLYVGSSPRAIVYQVLGRNRARAIHDFAGNEVRALHVAGETIYAAVNKIDPDRYSGLKLPGTVTGKGTPITSPAEQKYQVQLPRLGAKQGEGAVFALDRDGAARQLHAVKPGYFTAVERLPSGIVYAAEGTYGRVYALMPDHSVATAYQVAERQVLSLALRGAIRAIGTGDSGSVYGVGQGGKPPRYRSAPHDTGNASRFGTLSYRASGAVGVETRSGNTAKPGPDWSAWQTVAVGQPSGGGLRQGPVRSPAARYLQLRFTWPAGSRAEVYLVQVHYTPVNQAPVFTELKVGEVATGKTPVVKAAWIGSPTTAAAPELKVEWKVTDPDGDPLVFRAYYRAVGDPDWRRMGDQPFVTETNLKWKTDTLPDGWYEVKVVASDERSNSPDRTQARERVSGPVLVDHTKPEILGLKVNYPFVSGTARDAASRVSGVVYSLDGKVWLLVDPVDGNWDQESEAFSFRLRPPRRPGTYTLLVQAYDAAGNAQVVKQTIRVK